MRHTFTLEYWQDDGWYVGTLKEMLGIFSQGATLSELEENIADVYKLMLQEQVQPQRTNSYIKEISVVMM